MKIFKNKVAVITGGGSGFGREFAIIGARLGMKLVLADVQQEALDKVKVELEAPGAEVLAARCDVRKAEEIQALADAAMARFGAVHLLFNNAGVGSGGLVWESTQAMTVRPSMADEVRPNVIAGGKTSDAAIIDEAGSRWCARTGGISMRCGRPTRYRRSVLGHG